MKARSFFLALAAAVMVLLTITAGLWWAMAQQSPLKLAQQPLELPRAARFIPRQATLSLHWLVDPGRLPAYAQAVAPSSQRRAARDVVQQLRDGAFGLAGLEFSDELADWVGPEVSLALLDGPSDEGRLGWVMALSSRDQDGAKRFLQRFWQTRSLAGTDLQISRYRGMGVISGRGALLGRDPQPLATALIDDDLLLLASGRGVLEQALDVSQLQDMHQLGDADLQRRVSQLGTGVALITASPQALSTWLGMPADVVRQPDLEGLVAALGFQGANLSVDGMLRFRSPVVKSSGSAAAATASGRESLLSSAGGNAEALAVLTNPASLLAPASEDPQAQWLGPVLSAQLKALSAPGLDAITTHADGPLLWAQLKEGWLLGTQSGHPGAEAVDEVLKGQGLVASSLEAERGPLKVWTKLQRKRSHGSDSLQAQLAVALAKDGSQEWWGESLDALQQRRDDKALQPRLQQLKALDDGEAPLPQQLALAAPLSRDQLQRWRPWTLVQTVAGRSLLDPVQGLAVGVGPASASDNAPGREQAGSSDSLRLRVLLNLG
ncbi:MAG: DUF3352 domain-containing protein [Synechococcus sp.]|nr:DUF3352 domain-containing protein [Synechococcus sp.]